jgi:hypothetical protein
MLASSVISFEFNHSGGVFREELAATSLGSASVIPAQAALADEVKAGPTTADSFTA